MSTINALKFLFVLQNMIQPCLGDVVSCNLARKIQEGPLIYQLKAQKFGLFNVFSRLQILIEKPTNSEVFSSASKEDLIQEMKANRASFLGRMFTWILGSFSDGSNQHGNETIWEVSPFSDHFIGIPSASDVTIICNFTAFDVTLLALFLLGIFTFFFAESFSRNVMFYYASGLTISLLMSWMIILIIILRLIPYKKSIFAVTLVGGSFGLYLTQSLLLNLQFYAKYHAYWLLWYAAVVSLLSLAFLYYKGPPSNVRFLNLAKYCMQLLGLMCVYNCTWAKEVAVTAIVFTVTMHLILLHFDVGEFISKNFLGHIFKTSNRIPKRRFLTEEEYQEEGIRETAKALKELRQYCSSPKADTWKIVSRLKNPKKFSSFMETGNTFDCEELEEYEKYEPEEGDDSWLSSDGGEELERTKSEKIEDEEDILVSDDSL